MRPAMGKVLRWLLRRYIQDVRRYGFGTRIDHSVMDCAEFLLIEDERRTYYGR
jgi:hypothetical protein